jgi:hypothetical protein
MMTTIPDFIEERLDSMLANPEFWGDAEAFELQVILLLEIRTALRTPRTPAESLRWILDQYYSFLRARRPDAPPQPLSAVVGEDFGLIAGHLQGFREHLSRIATDAEAGSESEDPPSAPPDLGVDVAVDVQHSRMPRAA